MVDNNRHLPDAGSGAMTEATGTLTPDTEDEAFVPAELRAMNEPHRSVAASAGAHGRRVQHDSADHPGSLDERPLEALAPNDRDGGYGSEHGLAPNDPAYVNLRRGADRRD